jgi:hypothetical protein
MRVPDRRGRTTLEGNTPLGTLKDQRSAASRSAAGNHVPLGEDA